MAFDNFSQDQALIILESGQGDVGTFTPAEDAKLEACDLFFFKQGNFSSSVLSIVILDGATPIGTGSIDVKDIDSLGTNVIGKVRIDFDKRVNLVGSTAYTIRFNLTNYSPVINGGMAGETFIALLRDWPITMAYNSTIGNFTTEPIAINFYEAT